MSAKLQFTTIPLPEMGHQFKGSCSRDPKSSACRNLSESEQCMKLIHGEQNQYKANPSDANNHGSQFASDFTRDGDSCALTHVDNVAGRRADEGYVDVDRMELEERGEATAAF